ncbi:MAG: 2OG-Fe(II) oxygenase family protein [Gammaproteobacteria bacterium]
MHVLNVNYTSKEAPQLFCQSLKETGFAVLNHHPLSTQLIEDVYKQWRDFFYSEEKHNYLYRKEEQDGYFPFRSETAKGKKISDLKEFYHLYPWGRVPNDLKENSLALYSQLQQLAAQLLQWIEDFLPQEVSQQLSMPLRKMIEESPKTLLRILHYPPLQGDFEKGAERAAPHEDINLITLLPAATTPGLEVLDTHGHWHAVSCDPGNIVVNVGDMLQMCTRYYYKSTTHRVINPKDETASDSRFSMPLFLHPRAEVRLSPTHTAIEYLHERLRELGVY